MCQSFISPVHGQTSSAYPCLVKFKIVLKTANEEVRNPGTEALSRSRDGCRAVSRGTAYHGYVSGMLEHACVASNVFTRLCSIPSWRQTEE